MIKTCTNIHNHGNRALLLTFWVFDENMHENGHDENQENEANQNVLNVIVQEDNDEMNNAMIVEDSVDKLIPRNSNSFDLLNKDYKMTMKPVWRLEI